MSNTELKKKLQNMTSEEKERLTTFLVLVKKINEEYELEKDLYNLMRSYSKKDGLKSFNYSIGVIKELRKKNLINNDGVKFAITANSTALICGTIEREFKKSFKKAFAG